MRAPEVSTVLWVTLAIAAVIVAALAAGRMGAFTGQRPDNLGLREGKLKPPSKTPNSVTSQAALWPDHPQQERAAIAPLGLQGDGASTIARIAAVVEAMRGAHIVERKPDYLHAEFTTKHMRFVDDVEFWFDPSDGVIHVRSASRVGRGDRGVNRARIERIRMRLAAG